MISLIALYSLLSSIIKVREGDGSEGEVRSTAVLSTKIN